MIQELCIRDSWAPLVELITNERGPIELCGHTGTGKVSATEDIAKHIGLDFVDLTGWFFSEQNGKLIWPPTASKIISGLKKPSLVFYHSADRQASLSRLMPQFLELFDTSFFEQHRLIITTNPATIELCRELLGEDLKRLSRERFEGNVGCYKVNAIAAESYSRLKRVFVEPSITRCLAWAQEELHPLLFKYIVDVNEMNPDNGWLALFGILVGRRKGFSVYPGDPSKLSVRSWLDLSECLKSLKKNDIVKYNEELGLDPQSVSDPLLSYIFNFYDIIDSKFDLGIDIEERITQYVQELMRARD